MRSALFVVLLLARIASAQAQVIAVTGVVTDSMTNAPLKGAMVYVLNGGKTLTDDQGRFRLKGVDTGRDVLVVRRVGYLPIASRFARRPSGTEVDLGTLALQPLAVLLDSLTVEAQLTMDSRKLADFYRRRAASTGSFFTRKEIAEHNPMVTSDLLRGIPGIVLLCDRGPCVPATLRRSGLRASNAYCQMQVVLDGVPTARSVDEIPPAWIAGIEVYKGSAQGPTEFGSTGQGGGTSPVSGGNRSALGPLTAGSGSLDQATPFCGTVAIWTGGGS